jgi:hypothetical protein
MTHRSIKVGAAVTAALAFAGAAAGAPPSASTLTLQASDLAGAKLISQKSVKAAGFVTAYRREFSYAAPTSSGLLFVESETRVAASATTATVTVTNLQRGLGLKAARVAVAAALARQLKLKPSAVVVGALKKGRVGDQSLELPISIKVKGGRVYLSMAYFRIDKVVGLLVEAGLKPVTSTAQLESLVAGHIGTALTPVDVAAPSVTGTAVQGQTLSAASGTWDPAGTAYAFQWQHCDASGANCADVAGATAQSYAVTSADAGTTLRVNVTATNRFGSAVASSPVTAVVS